jgi:hypothetical protein
MTLKKLLIVLILLAGGYYAYENYIKAKPPPPPPQAPSPNPYRKVICYQCDQLGRLVDSSGIGYKCPICDGMGSRVNPSHLPDCEECKGMGKTVDRKLSSKRIIARRCPLCQGLRTEKKTGF